MLRTRHTAAKPDSQLVFPPTRRRNADRVETPYWTSNITGQISTELDRLGHTGISGRSFRKMVATELDKHGYTPRQAADNSVTPDHPHPRHPPKPRKHRTHHHRDNPVTDEMAPIEELPRLRATAERACSFGGSSNAFEVVDVPLRHRCRPQVGVRQAEAASTVSRIAWIPAGRRLIAKSFMNAIQPNRADSLAATVSATRPRASRAPFGCGASGRPGRMDIPRPVDEARSTHPFRLIAELWVRPANGRSRALDVPPVQAPVPQYPTRPDPPPSSARLRTSCARADDLPVDGHPAGLPETRRTVGERPSGRTARGRTAERCSVDARDAIQRGRAHSAWLGGGEVILERL